LGVRLLWHSLYAYVHYDRSKKRPCNVVCVKQRKVATLTILDPQGVAVEGTSVRRRHGPILPRKRGPGKFVSDESAPISDYALSGHWGGMPQLGGVVGRKSRSGSLCGVRLHPRFSQADHSLSGHLFSLSERCWR
jgi:hypothetical protein